MALKKDFKLLVKPYYLINILMSLSYVILKNIPGVCNFIFRTDVCEFDGRETEILFFLVVVVMIRSRKSGSVTMINYLSASFVYTKIANCILWYHADIYMGAGYTLLFLIIAILFPEPTYDGPSNVVYFGSSKHLEMELEKDPRIVWIVCFYTVWNPLCVNLAPVFAEISVKYNLDLLKFGKIDLGRYPDASKRFLVSDSPLSKQLPTIVMFKEGKEVSRRPTFDVKGKLMKFLFSEQNIVAAFDLNNQYESCKKEAKDGNSKKSLNKKKN
ncbi:unnamed protein product [Brassicogethes aeneus]|uniref:Thioredoxin domain-containing protein n=1 Tax=Brassicogethes aeneus TaxID=1431903 RepID=A0A9P0AVE0_BRAAE|nr:unnamed protein product [Brassicogethes aeneus]